MWGMVFKAGLFIGSVIYQAYNKFETKKLKASDDTSNFPRFREGEGISVVFGYAYIKDPQVVWYKLSDTISSDVRVSYWCNFQEKLCLSNIDSLEFIFLDGAANRCDWNGDIDDPEYYGWSSNETDVLIMRAYRSIGTDQYDYDPEIITTKDIKISDIDIEFGGDSQTPNLFLETSDQQGTTISANRGVVGIVWKNKLIGSGNAIYPPTPTPNQYLVKRTDIQHDGTAQWLPLKAHCGYGLNVIHAIRELIISERIGGGNGSSLIDSTTFEAAANQCFTDGIGVSFHYNNVNGAARELIDDLLHTYAIGDMHFDMDSATFKIKLFRDDYTYATLPEVVASDVIVVKNLTKEDAAEVVNSVNVMYTDRFNFELKAAPYQDDSSISRIGINSQVVNMPYLMNPTYALKMATQIVLFSTAQLHTCQIEAPLEYDEYNTGDVFNLTDARNGLDKVTFRVLSKVRAGRGSEKITLSVMEDIFGIGEGSMGSGDNEPEYPVLIDVKYGIIKEAPYFITRGTDPAPDTSLGESLSSIIAFCVQPKNYIGFGLWYKLHVDTDFTQYSAGSMFNNSTSLDGSIGYNDTELTITTRHPYGGGAYVLIDDEIMYVYAKDLYTISVYRGMQDTLPEDHADGSIVYFFSIDSELSGSQEFRGVDVDSIYDFKLVSEALSGSQNPVDATTNSLTPENRSIRPYNAGGFVVNEYGYENDGVLWIGVADGSLIEWLNRNRLTGWYQEIIQTDSSITVESGVVYAVEIWDDTDTTLKRVENLINAEEYDYTTTLETTDFGALDDKIVKLSSKRLRSATPFVFTNTDNTSSITASTKTILWKGEDLTGKVQIGYSITLANTSLNNNTLTVNSITESGGDSTIIVDETCYDETLTGLDETLSVPDYWESYQKWSILVKRMSAPAITYDAPSRTFSFADVPGTYTTTTFFYTYGTATAPSTPSEPSDPTTSDTKGTSYTHPVGENVWIKVMARIETQGVPERLSAVAELKNY